MQLYKKFLHIGNKKNEIITASEKRWNSEWEVVRRSILISAIYTMNLNDDVCCAS